MPEASANVSIEKVLFATDFSSAAANAFSYAAAISNRYQAKLVVAHVINPEGSDGRAEAVAKINQLLEPLHLAHERFEISVGEGVVSETLVQMIEQHHIDVAVLGTHGRQGLQKLRLGSVAEEVFRVAPCPVLTAGANARPAASTGLRHILYPVHFAPDFSKAADYAVSLAERYGATLTVMNVRDDMPASENVPATVSEPVERWMNDHIPQSSELRKRVRFESGFGPAANAILDFVAKAGVDIIVMSARRLDPVIAAHLPKADTVYELVSHGVCPVLTVRE